MPAAGRLSSLSTSPPPSPASGPSPILVPESPILPDGSRFDPSRSAASTSAAAASREGDDIEMEPIAGHRRRKSSLMNPVGSHPGGPSSRPGAPGHRSGPSLSVPLDLRIFEDDDAARPGESAKDGSGRDSFSDEDLHDDEETGLTNKDRSRRQKKRRRNTLLHNRIAREKNISEDERREADKSVVRRLVTNGVFILLWYMFSLSISFVSFFLALSPFCAQSFY